MTEDTYRDHLYALILAGGGGTRLWPRSRNKTPKQFLKLFGGKTLIQITAKRLRKILPWKNIFVVTVSNEYKKEVLKQVPRVLPENIIVEPARRDTGPAQGLGALHIFKQDSDAVIITESADRLVNPVSSYLRTLLAAAKVAHETGNLVAMGVKPQYPNTGLGYIKRGEKLEYGKKIRFFKLEKFVEKPPIALAKKYTSSGKYYWNAGQYVWKAEALLAELKKHSKSLSNNLQKISDAVGTSSENAVISSVYKKLEVVPIDVAVSEKSKNMCVVEGLFNWTDIGDWNEVWKNLPHDGMGNVIIDGDEPGGELINVDTSDALIHKDGRLIAVLDVDNIIVVDTKDALLIASKSRAQNVKKIVNILKEKKKTELL